MANKQIIDYDAKTGLARDDYFLEQDNAGGLYTKTTPAQILGLLQTSDLPAGVLKTPAAISTTLQSVEDKDGNASALQISTTNAVVSDGTTTAGLGDFSFSSIPAFKSAYIGQIAHASGWGGSGFLFSNASGGTGAFSLVCNGDVGYFGFVDGTSSSLTGLMVFKNGKIRMPNLPTSSSGLSSGDLWNDSGTVKIV
jgi:hypothetical protein